MLNEYTKYKITNLDYNISDKEKSHYLNMLEISDKIGVIFDEPTIDYKSKKFMIFGGYHRKGYRVGIEKKLGVLYKYNLILRYDQKEITSEKFKLSEVDKMVKSIKDFIDNDSYENYESYDQYIEDIEKYKNLDEGWNGYACNSMSEDAVDNAIEYFKYLSQYFNYYNITLCPTADSGHIINRPENSNSGVRIYLDNEEDLFNKKHIELDFNRDEVSIWGYRYVWNEEAKKHDIVHDFPSFDMNDDMIVTNKHKLIEYLSWAFPKLKGEVRSKRLNEVLDN